jgi:hypothetical protein
MRRVLFIVLVISAIVFPVVGWSTESWAAGTASCKGATSQLAIETKQLAFDQKALNDQIAAAAKRKAADEKRYADQQTLINTATSQKNAAGAALKKIDAQMELLAADIKADPTSPAVAGERGEYNSLVAAGNAQLGIIKNKTALLTTYAATHKAQLATIEADTLLLERDESPNNALKKKVNSDNAAIKQAQDFLKDECASPTPVPIDITGTWDESAKCPGGSSSGPFTISNQQPDGTFDGTFTDSTIAGRFQTNAVTFTRRGGWGEQHWTATLDSTYRKMTGDITGKYGPCTFSAVKQ